MKNYFLVLLAIFGVSVIATPNLSAAKTDTIPTTPVEQAVEAESTLLSELDEISSSTLTEVVSTVNITSSSTSSNRVSLGYDYAVTSYSPSIMAHPDYDNIYKTGKLIYAHNTKQLFGDLSSYHVGSTITILEQGVLTTYQVTDVKTFEKNPENGLLQLGGQGSYMKLIVDKAFYHDIALMTCAGQPNGKGDASHRLVIFADRT